MYTDKEIEFRWKLLFERCYHGTDPAYCEVTICKEWNDFYVFKEWFIKNIYGTKQFKLEIDKDLFSNGNKLYSPETCCFLPKSINILLSTCKSRNEYLPGVTKTKNGKFLANMNRNITRIRKPFNTEEEAFQYYKKNKEKSILIAANAYKFLLPNYIYEALINYKIIGK